MDSVGSLLRIPGIAKSSYAKETAELEKEQRTYKCTAKNQNAISANASQPQEGELIYHCDLMHDDASALSSKVRASSYASKSVTHEYNPSAQPVGTVAMAHL